MKRRAILINATNNMNELVELRSTEDMLDLLEAVAAGDGIGALVFPEKNFKENFANIINCINNESISTARVQSGVCVRDMLNDLLPANL